MQLSVKCVCRLSIRLRSYGAAGLSRASFFFKVIKVSLPRLARVLAGGGRLATLVRRSVCALTIQAALHLYIHVQMMTELLHLSHYRCHIHVCAQPIVWFEREQSRAWTQSRYTGNKDAWRAECDLQGSFFSFFLIFSFFRFGYFFIFYFTCCMISCNTSFSLSKKIIFLSRLEEALLSLIFFFDFLKFFIFHFFFIFYLRFFLYFSKKERFLPLEQVKGNARDGRSRHRPTNHSFRVWKVNLATLKVAIFLKPMERRGREEEKSTSQTSKASQGTIVRERRHAGDRERRSTCFVLWWHHWQGVAVVCSFPIYTIIFTLLAVQRLL